MSDTYEPTLQHIAIINAKLRKLEAAQVEAETQVIHRLASDYAAGTVTAADVYAAYLSLRDTTVGGFPKRWNGRMPYELQSARIVWTAVRYAPDEDGIWRGEYPFTADSGTPAPKASVVYVLYDPHNEPCYVGSTEQFRTRLSAHARDGKAFVRWIAHPCADREAAYHLEAKLLAEYMPHLNRRAGR